MGVAQTWRMLSLLYCDKQTDLQQLGFLPPHSGLQSQLSYRVVSMCIVVNVVTLNMRIATCILRPQGICLVHKLTCKSGHSVGVDTVYGKTFAVGIEKDRSLENIHSSSMSQ